MTMTTVGQVYLPTPQVQGSGGAISLSASTITYDSANDRLAWIGRSPLDDTLETIYIRTGTVTTGCTVSVRVETVTNGRPSGTLWDTNTSASVVIDNADDNVFKTATLTAGAVLTAGDEFAIVIVVTSGTPNLNFVGQPNGVLGAPVQSHYPLALQDTGGGTWASAGTGFNWICQFSTAGVYPMMHMHAASGGGTIDSFNSSSTPDEYALKFAPTVKYRVIGVRLIMFNIAAGADFTVSLWDSSGNEDVDALAQVSQDGDFPLSATTDGAVDLYFPTAVTLTKGSTYYLGVRADTANNIGLGRYSNTLVTNAMRAMHGTDSSMMSSTRSWTAGTAGAWTDTSTSIPLISLIIDQFDDGAAGGGSGFFFL